MFIFPLFALIVVSVMMIQSPKIDFNLCTTFTAATIAVVAAIAVFILERINTCSQ